MSLRRTCAVLALCLFPLVGPVAAAAQTADTGPDQLQEAAVEGIVRHDDGSPAVGASVRISDDEGPGLEWSPALFFSLGLECVLDGDACSDDFFGGKTSTTAADGTYRGSLPDSYLPGAETDTDWVVNASFPRPMARSPAPGPRSSSRSTSPSRPPRLVAFAAAGAGVRVPHANGRTIYHQGFATPAVALPAFDLVPPSRGAPCSTVRADGTVAPADRRWRCDATDGNRRWTLDPRIVSVTLELEAETEVADVFVPDCPEGCAVDVSADGATWSTLVESHPRDSATFRYSHLLIATSPVPQRARFVRLTRTEGLDGVTEGSVWPARPPPPPEPVPPTTLANGVPGEGAPPVPDDDGGGLLVPAAVAGLALGAAVIGASRASARRPV